MSSKRSDPIMYVSFNPTPKPRKYGFFHFLFDCFMFFLTGGLWLIWIFVREMRK